MSRPLLAGGKPVKITHLEASLRLNPRAHLVPIFTSIGMTHFLCRRFEEAVGKLLLAVEERARLEQDRLRTIEGKATEIED